MPALDSEMPSNKQTSLRITSTIRTLEGKGASDYDESHEGQPKLAKTTKSGKNHPRNNVSKNSKNLLKLNSLLQNIKKPLIKIIENH